MKYTTLTKKDFSWVNMNAKDIDNIAQVAIRDIKVRIEVIKKIKSKERTFANTVLAYENVSEEEGIKMAHVHTLELCSDKLEVREAARKCEIEMSSGLVDIVYDIDLYKSIKDYYDNNYKIESKQKAYFSKNISEDNNNFKILDEQDMKLVEDMMSDFARMGFDLAASERNKIKNLEKKISKLASAYDANIAEDKSHILCTLEELDGVPENIIASFTKVEIKKKVQSKNINHPVGDSTESNKKKEIGSVSEYKYKVSVDYPEYGPYMKYATNTVKREELYRLFNNVGGNKNVKILEELVKLRQDKAKILGHDNHGEYVISDRMAKNTKTAYKMLNDVLNKIKIKKDEEIIEIVDKAKEIGISKKELKNSDIDYVANRIRNEKYAYNEQEVREYFPLDHVLSSMFELFGDLFGFEVVESLDNKNKTIKLWHKDAKLYELRDTKMKCVIGYMVMDLFPREGKFGHACMMPLVSGKVLDNSYRSGLVAIICNFSKAQNIGKNKTPSLLTIGEVETLYHEFGHGIHSLLSKAKHNSHSGTNVVWDFVETPSQIMEEWVTDERVLSKISKHYITGKPLPKSIINKIKSLDKFMKGYFYTRQALQSILDLDIYTGKLGGSSTVEHYHKLRAKYMLGEMHGILFVSKFAHIARGYDAGYYSYMWAERISKDIYSEFKNRQEHKNSNGKYKVGDYKSFGLKYRKEILEMGSSRDENSSVRELLGREVDSEGFVRGII